MLRRAIAPLLWTALLASLTLSTPAWAAETTTFTYDALGRLVATSVSGGPTNGLATTSQYDPAGNRANYKVTGSNYAAPTRRVIVLPLNGYTIIPIP